MEHKRFVLTTVIIVALGFGFAHQAIGQQKEGTSAIGDSVGSSGPQSVEDLLPQVHFPEGGDPMYPFTTLLRPEWDNTPGLVNLVLTIYSWPFNKGTEYEIAVADREGMEMISQMPMTATVQLGDSLSVWLQVRVPAADTSRLRLETRCGDERTINNASFTADSSKAGFWPTWYRGRIKRANVEEVILPNDSRRRRKLIDSLHNLGVQMRTGYYVEGVGVVSADSHDASVLPPERTEAEDSQQSHGSETPMAWSQNADGEWMRGPRDSIRHEMDAREVMKQLRNLEEREESACTLSGEHLWIDGKMYTRSEGEYEEFRIAQPITDRSAYIDSLQQAAKSEQSPSYHVVVDLSDPEDSAWIAGLVDSLVPFDSAHLYHTVVDRSVAKQLNQSDVPWNLYPRRPGQQPILPTPAPSPPEGNFAEPLPKGMVDIYQMDFELSWPTTCQIGDMDSACGLDYWGRVDYTQGYVHGGTRSGWCSENGDMELGYRYDECMEAYLRFPEANLAPYDSILSTYWFFSVTDPWDYFSDWISYDGDNWYELRTVSGTAGGWDWHFDQRLLTPGGPCFREFWFTSDEDLTMPLEGTYVDDYGLTGYLPPRPNLRCCDVAACDEVMCVNPVFGDTLYRGEEFTVDFAVRNEGTVASGEFTIDILADDTLIESVCCENGIPAGECLEFVNLVYAVTAIDGDHEITIRVDADSDVLEESEYDNECDMTFLWGYLPPPPGHPDLIANDDIGVLPEHPFVGEEALFSYSFRNGGDTTSGPFLTRLLLDDSVVVHQYSCQGLPPDSAITFHGEEYIVPPPADYHVVTVQVDYSGMVDESYEGNNTRSQIFDWEPATIQVVVAPEYGVYVPQGDNYQICVAADFYVSIWDADSGDAGDLLDSGWTDQYGVYTSIVLDNQEEDGTRQDLFVLIESRTPRVRVGTSAAPYNNWRVTPYKYSSDTIHEACSGSAAFGFLYGNPFVVDTTGGPTGGMFYCADVISRGWDLWKGWSGATDSVVDVEFTDLRTQYVFEFSGDTLDLILVQHTQDGVYYGYDQWNADVLLDELGGRICFVSGFFDEGVYLAGQDSSHVWDDTVSVEFAATEGFARFFSCAARNDPVEEFYRNVFLDTVYWALESGERGQHGQNKASDSVFGCLNCYNPKNDGTVASLLWDIYDSNDDDYSSESDWGELDCDDHDDDGIEDTLSLEHSSIVAALTTALHPDPNIVRFPDNMDEFWQAWRHYPDLGHCQALVDVYFEHGFDILPDSTDCTSCCTLRGDINNDGQETIDIGDLIYLVNFMFQAGPEPLCLEQTNVNGQDGSAPDIGDLIYLVNFMFQSGPPPPPCA